MIQKYRLHTGIQKITKSNGIDIIRTVRLANILADYSAYDEYPATKEVLKDILTKGYGQKISDEYNKSGNGALNEIEKLKQEYQKSTTFKKDVVSYVFDSICYGLGLKSLVKEPMSNGFDAYANTSDNILDKLPEMLAELKTEYQDSLNKLITKPKDIIWDAPAYFSAQADNQLYLIEGKIQVINKQLGINDNNWCLNMKKTLDSHKQKKINTVREVLDSKKAEFTVLLNKALVNPASSYISKSGHFAEDKASEIEKLETEIKGLYSQMYQKYDNWCENEKIRILSPYIVSDSNRMRQILLKIAMPVAMFCGFGYYGGTYAVSSDSIDAYEQRMSDADNLLNNGDYGKAIAGFMQASGKYDGSFRTGAYKSDALSKADDCFDNLQSHVSNLLDKKQYADVLSLFATIPVDYLSANQDKSGWIEKTKLDMQDAVSGEIDQLANMISANGGHLSEESKKYLEQLLAVSPDNYWLNLIKTKEK